MHVSRKHYSIPFFFFFSVSVFRHWILLNSTEYYAHRFMPAVFVQEIKITNTMTQMIDVDLTRCQCHHRIGRMLNDSLSSN